MTEVCIIRHAEVIYPVDDQGRKLMYPPETHLSDEGKKQFNFFAMSLRKNGIKIDLIETSPYVRANESAIILASVFGIKKPVINPNLVDSYIPGWIGIPLSEAQKLMDRGKDIYQHPRTPDQELYEHIAGRMVNAFRGIVDRYSGKTVAIISHGDPIRLLMYRLKHPKGKIPNMSILSKDGYLKRGEACHVKVDHKGNVFETELISNREGVLGERELYKDNPLERAL